MVKVIGEIGINHNGDLNVAKKLIDISALSGFDYVKFQKRDVDLCVPEHKKNELKKGTPWGDITYYEYKKKVEFSRDEYIEIDKYCKEKGVKWFASVWDVNSIDFMKEFCNIVKIPSALISNTEVLKKARASFDTVIMSTGMSTEDQIKKAVNECKPDVIMHTNSTYPTPLNEMNMEYIEWLKDKYHDIKIGYSGHEFGLIQSISTVLMGVSWIERHITLDRNMWGSDQKASVEPVGMFKLIKGIRETEQALGGFKPRELYESEKSKLKDLRK